jgi:CRISPR-associated protein Csx17
LLPGKFRCPEFGVDEGIDIAMEPSMLSMLRAGRMEDAYRIACRRLRECDLRPISDDPGTRNGLEQGRRLAAALLFPLDDRSHGALAERALRKPDQDN